MTKKKVEFVETILNWFNTPRMGREIDVKFLEGAYKQPYEAGRNDAINEACEWLELNAYLYCDDIDTLHESALLGDFRYVMEGGQQ